MLSAILFNGLRSGTTIQGLQCTVASSVLASGGVHLNPEQDGAIPG